MQTKYSSITGTKYPIIQGGMVWVSGWRLANAVGQCGGLGVIGAGSMNLEILEEHLLKIRKKADVAIFAVNLPLLNHDIESKLDLILKYKVPIVITSAGDPKKFTQKLKQVGVKVFHVVSSLKFALKAQAAGVDAVIVEGFEAGGHNGREETTSLVLMQEVYEKLNIPVIAAGGFGSGQSIAAAMCLGATAVQLGSVFVPTLESSAHDNYKKLLVSLTEGQTKLSLKQLTPVRLIKNHFFDQVEAAEENCATKEELALLLGKGRAKRGMFEGDLEEGELEIGQIISQVTKLESVEEVMQRLVNEYNETLKKMEGKWM